MTIQELVQLRSFNTLGLTSVAEFFVRASSAEGVLEALQVARAKNLCVRAIGGGSNVILPPELSGLTLNVALKGRTIVSQSSQEAIVRVYAGEDWHEAVVWAHELGLYGLENLALIPGSVGAAPVQNIGAYGVELKEVMEECTFLQKDTLTERVLSVADCQLNYRDSIFKNELKGKGVVTSVQFRLAKSPHPLHTSYGALENQLQGRPRTIQSVAEAVIRIRQNKLPDPKQIGNCGSFFKNPILSLSRFEALQKKHPQLPSYPSKTGVKVPAAWLIDQLGFKGVRRGDAGVHPKQALVLVNHGNATGAEIWALAEDIQKAVHAQFGIALEPEVTCY